MKDLTLPELPGIGVEVDNLDLLRLAVIYGKDDIVQDLRGEVPPVPFSSDGCSCWPDSFFWFIGGFKKVSIYPYCFWHDVRYWLGKPGDDLAKLYADTELMKDVAAAHSIELAELMFAGVRAGGIEELKLPFSWGFGWNTK